MIYKIKKEKELQKSYKPSVQSKMFAQGRLMPVLYSFSVYFISKGITSVIFLCIFVEYSQKTVRATTLIMQNLEE